MSDLENRISNLESEIERAARHIEKIKDLQRKTLYTLTGAFLALGFMFLAGYLEILQRVSS